MSSSSGGPCPWCGATGYRPDGFCTACRKFDDERAVSPPAKSSLPDGTHPSPRLGDSATNGEDDEDGADTSVTTSIAADGTVTTTKTITTTTTSYGEDESERPWYVGSGGRRSTPLGMVIGGIVLTLVGLGLGSTSSQSCTYDQFGNPTCVSVSNWGIGAFLAVAGVLLLAGGLYWHQMAGTWDTDNQDEPETDTSVKSEVHVSKVTTPPWRCTYCGRANAAQALTCAGCGASK